MTESQINLIALPDIPDILPGDDLPAVILAALKQVNLCLQSGDVVVVTQKIVSKAEGCAIPLETVIPSPKALALAEVTDKDPRLVEVILRESRGVIRQRGGTLIMETRHGWICANAGVDRSNIGGNLGEVALPLPPDPDASAQRIREALQIATSADIAVLITDTHGRPWREGTVNVTIGSAGMMPLADLRGTPDRYGYILRATIVARADELAAAAGLLMGQAGEGIPVVLIRGAEYPRGDERSTQMQRPPERDLFR